jgi:hypothetical protein
MEAKAKDSKQTVSEWVRTAVSTAVNQFTIYCPVCKENVTASIPMTRRNLVEALEHDAEIPFVHLLPLAPDHKPNLTRAQKENVRKHLATGTL